MFNICSISIKKLYTATRYVFVVNYEDLSEIRRKESSSPMPIKIEPDFYKSLARYLNSLEEELMKERKKDPNSNRATLLADELKNATRLSEEIYGKREKKIIQVALAAARGGKPKLKYLMEEEKILYDDTLEILKRNREKIFAKKAKKESKESRKLGESKKDTAIVRGLKDVPSFIGEDMKNYEIKKEDILTLPRKTASILIKRGVVEEIKTKFDS